MVELYGTYMIGIGNPFSYNQIREPASVTQVDACTTGDQEVVDSTPAGLAIFFRGDLIMNYFLWSFFPLH